MSSEEQALRQQISELCASLFARGFSVGTAGNVSARLHDGILMTPTNSTLGDIDPERIAKIDLDGNHVSGTSRPKRFFCIKPSMRRGQKPAQWFICIRPGPLLCRVWKTPIQTTVFRR